jgi:hypothetical protein
MASSARIWKQERAGEGPLTHRPRRTCLGDSHVCCHAHFLLPCTVFVSRSPDAQCVSHAPLPADRPSSLPHSLPPCSDLPLPGSFAPRSTSWRGRRRRPHRLRLRRELSLSAALSVAVSSPRCACVMGELYMSHVGCPFSCSEAA